MNARQLLAIAAMPLAAQAEPATAPETVRVGVFLVAPYVIAGSSGPQGALVKFFDQEIAPRMGVRFEWE